MSTSDVRDRRRSDPVRRPGAGTVRHPHRLPADLLLAVAVAVHAAVLWVEPGVVIELGALPSGLRVAFRVIAPVFATLLLGAQVMSLLGRLGRLRHRIVAWTVAWWVFAGVESMLADWRSSVWLTELSVAWLATHCLRAVARAEARDLPSVVRGS
ncbi:hypothetical protein AB0H57_22115 [Micromonospora sp. NPDC050686]|uniref:hypothetical protein n=1 Tax=Micromonospora sp. NPDC050686 TaxID=3154631 RepID=UPI0033C2080A